MSENLATFYQQSELALAAYSQLSSGITGDSFVSALREAGMSQSQAQRFAATWSVVDQYTDPWSGFSATLFESGGQRYLAIRGTDGFFSVDTLADAQLLFGGAARNQIVSLYNYVQRLVTPAGQPAVQVEDAAPDIDPITGHVSDPGGIRTTTSVAGLGYLAGVSGIAVTGHSLGGHLAAAASYLFPTLIGATYTFNAPGFSLNYAKALLDQFPGSAAAFPATITNLVAHAGADIIAAVGTLPGVPVRIEIENQLPNPIGNHYIVPLNDALAIYNLFARLDPTASASAIDGILSAASSSAAKTLEVTLAAVGKLFGKTYPNTETTRDTLYVNLYDLQGAIPGGGALTEVSLVGMDANTLADTAKPRYLFGADQPEKSQSPQDGEDAAANDCAWRKAA
ncbi:MAG: hypothetical protein KDD77_01720 [Caldilineaceae bacterium]|nr:hypothetical protein [Rhodocyclaceae bacterium]MCB0065835.1 hypothetical protein [Caldilineaceae bacterium]